MATQTVKVTYSLQPETVRAVERMALRLGLSKSAALARMIRDADDASSATEALVALDQLQQRHRLTAKAADAWVREVSRERQATTRTGRR